MIEYFSMNVFRERNVREEDENRFLKQWY